jgi:SAM-dependent methyltransferase
MDIALEMLRAARRIGVQHCLTVTDIRTLSFAGNSFDAIFSNSTLDHFSSADQIAAGLGECHRILRPGGRLILTMDNPLNPVLALRQALPHWLLVKLGITTFYYGKTLAPGVLKKVLCDTGFKILNMEPILHCPRILAIFASRIIDHRATAGTKEMFLDKLNRFEKLAHLPTRYLTGYYTAVCCQK